MKVQIYRNNRNENKFIEVHTDKAYHRWARQYMEWKGADVKNLVGDGCLHKYRANDIKGILDDYTLVRTYEKPRTNYPISRKQIRKGSCYQIIPDTNINDLTEEFVNKKTMAYRVREYAKEGIGMKDIRVVDLASGKVYDNISQEEIVKIY